MWHGNHADAGAGFELNWLMDILLRLRDHGKRLTSPEPREGWANRLAHVHGGDALQINSMQ